MLLNAFLNFVLCLVVNNNSWGRSFQLNIFKLILKFVPVLFLTAVFSFFSCVSFNFTFFKCIQPFILIADLLLFLCKILTQFLLIVREYCIALFLYHDLLQQLLEIIFAELFSDQQLKLLVYLSRLQLVCNYLRNTHSVTNSLLYNHHLALLILFWLHHTVLSSHWLVDHKSFLHQSKHCYF